MSPIKPDLILSDGTEVRFDMSAITVQEYRDLPTKRVTRDKEDQILAKVTGIPVEQIVNLSMLEFKRIWKKFFVVFTQPLDDDRDPDNPN